MNPLVRLVNSAAFTAAVVTVILANALVLGLQTYPSLDRRHGDVLDLLNAIFLTFFVAEILLRVASYFPRPWRFFLDGWNVFDFVAVGLAFTPGLRENATVFRLARLARIVRVVHLLPDVRTLITAVVRSLPPLGSMAILTTLILFVYGMIGWQQFGEEEPQHWGTIGRAMLTLFVMLTLENFPQYMERGMEIEAWSWIFFVSFILVAAFIVLNVLIGIVLHSMEEARELERRRRLAPSEAGVFGIAPAPVAERIRYLRAALDELEQELAAADGSPPDESRTGRPR
jgi:voltage-gated sodium channel